jgi:hypothetical protein
MPESQSLIGQTLSHYRILEEIGHGGMGVVFRARDEQLDRDVAVKILPPRIFPNQRTRKRFHREAQVLAKLNHPNVAMAFDYGQEDGVDYLVTEFVGGMTLDAKLTNGPTVWVLGTSNRLWLTISFVRNPNQSASANCKTDKKGAFIGLRPFGKALTHSLKESRTELRYGRKKITAHRPWQKSVPPCLTTTSMRSVSSEWTLARDGSGLSRCRN